MHIRRKVGVHELFLIILDSRGEHSPKSRIEQAILPVGVVRIIKEDHPNQPGPMLDA
jgi:hypothetical protein